jgi:hypothetical protein
VNVPTLRKAGLDAEDLGQVEVKVADVALLEADEGMSRCFGLR